MSILELAKKYFFTKKIFERTFSFKECYIQEEPENLRVDKRWNNCVELQALYIANKKKVYIRFIVLLAISETFQSIPVKPTWS